MILEPQDTPALDLEERVEVATTRRARTAVLFGTVVWGLLAGAFWLTATPRRWIAVLVAIACAAALYVALR